MIVAGCIVLLILLSILLAWIDIRSGIIPDWLNLAIAILGVIRAAMIGGWPTAVELIAEGILIGAVVWALRWVYFRLRKVQGLGLGDVKLMVASGIWIGLDGVPTQLLVAACTALAVALALRLLGTQMTRHTALPFGPFLAFGLLVGIVLQ